jgi:hypothetical protein
MPMTPPNVGAIPSGRKGRPYVNAGIARNARDAINEPNQRRTGGSRTRPIDDHRLSSPAWNFGAIDAGGRKGRPYVNGAHRPRRPHRSRQWRTSPATPSSILSMAHVACNAFIDPVNDPSMIRQ